MTTTTAIIPRHHVAPLWESFHGLAAYGHCMRGGVVIEPTVGIEIPLGGKPFLTICHYRVTSGLALEIAG